MDANDLPEHGHEPVLLDEVLELLDPQPGEIALDCTLGRGGHAVELARRVGTGGTLIGLDADPDNLSFARERLEAAEVGCRLVLRHANFADAADVLDELDLAGVDVLLADLGVSTNQLMTASRGLSIAADADAPLDMRLDPDLPDTAADLLARWDERTVADTIYQYGDERFSRRIARRIVERRRERPIRTCGELAELVRRCVPRGRRSNLDPATRTFMALRMAVNREPAALQSLLDALPGLLKSGGRAAVISFHSGEDRPVKHALRGHAQNAGPLELLTRRPVTPGEAELDRNPRSRSAKLRAAKRRRRDDTP